MILSLLLLFSSFTYGSPIVDKTVRSVERDFKTTFTEVNYPDFPIIFFELEPSKMVLDVGTGNLRPNHANCRIKDNKPRIQVYKGWYVNEKNEWFKKKVLLHELGHCLLGLTHEVGGGIMTPSFKGFRIGPTAWKEYLKELLELYERP